MSSIYDGRYDPGSFSGLLDFDSNTKHCILDVLGKMSERKQLFAWLSIVYHNYFYGFIRNATCRTIFKFFFRDIPAR